MSRKKYEIMMNIDNLEGTINYLRNNEVYCATPEEISNMIDILEGIKTRLEDRLGA
jgi:hypothetical protein